jgi:hypothetical protein
MSSRAGLLPGRSTDAPRLHAAPRGTGTALTLDRIRAIQRTAGNRAVRQMLLRDDATKADAPPKADAKASTARAYPPWTRVWIGQQGVLGEVVEQDVTVRVFRDWEKLGIKDPPEAQTYECGPHDRKPIPEWVKKMREIAKLTAAANAKLPAAAPQRVAMVAIFGDSSSSAYRTANGRGLVVVSADEFDAGTYASTVAHESSHALYEHHSVRKSTPGKGDQRVPDAFALRFADLFTRMEGTAGVPIPKAKFDVQPPRLKVGESDEARAAGLVMVMDTLWAGDGGHPWGGPDEFFASAYAFYRHDPDLLRRSIKHYAKQDPSLTALGKELLDLLPLAGDFTAVDKLTGPAKPADAAAALVKAGAPLDVTGRQDQLGWMLDPEQMPAPRSILCPTPGPRPKR